MERHQDREWRGKNLPQRHQMSVSVNGDECGRKSKALSGRKRRLSERHNALWMEQVREFIQVNNWITAHMQINPGHGKRELNKRCKQIHFFVILPSLCSAGPVGAGTSCSLDKPAPPFLFSLFIFRQIHSQNSTLR